MSQLPTPEPSTTTPGCKTFAGEIADGALPAIPAPGREHPENTVAMPFLAEGVTLDQFEAALPGAVDLAMLTVFPGYHSPEKVEEITAEVISRIRQAHGTEPASCPVFRDCTETEPGHEDHHNHRLRVTGDDGSTILDAGMAALSGSETTAAIYVRNEEFTDLATVRAKTAELRQFLDQIDALADRVFADQKAYG